ncbi:hypothetical protein NPIL_703191 [Nephila pilipes]|uniref:Uncharacterized protein n=1 Tax=Nephila pilipes TaxID=299642 RepID=A0A8X6PTV9_NEPPI|nr:hypothetical protein NPIL_703191 [Nephila pilipes]
MHLLPKLPLRQNFLDDTIYLCGISFKTSGRRWELFGKEVKFTSINALDRTFTSAIDELLSKPSNDVDSSITSINGYTHDRNHMRKLSIHNAILCY